MFTGSAQALELRVGISFIDATHAQGNYNAQLGGGTASFDSVRNTTSATWNQLLSRVSVSPATPQVDCVSEEVSRLFSVSVSKYFSA